MNHRQPALNLVIVVALGMGLTLALLTLLSDQLVPVSAAATVWEAASDLEIGKSDGVETVDPGDTLTYTIAITNTGVQTATGVVLTDTLPLSTTFVGPAAQWQQVGSTPVYTHAVGDLAPGAGAYTTTLVVTVDTPLPADLEHITNTVQVTDDSDGHAQDTDVNTIGAPSPPPLPSGVITVCQDGSCPYSVIQDAVDAAENGEEIRVAAGTYTDVNNRGGLAQIVYLDKSVTLRGGYSSTNWTTPDPQANPTTLDAQGAGRVLYVTGDVDPTMVGLRITGGSAKRLGGPFSPPAADAGGGVYIRSSGGALRDSWIFSNTADAGAGLYVGGSSSVALVDNRITDNTAVSLGGGLCLYGTRVSVTDNYVAGNRASYGGGMFLRSNWDAALLKDNFITANWADWGGGLYVQLENGAIVTNELSKNTAIAGGGGLVVHASPQVSLNANTVSANLAQDGGGLYLYDTDVTIVNTIVADNRARGSGSGIYILQSSPRLLHTTLARNRPYEEPGQDAGINVASGTAALTNTILVAHATGVYAGPGAAVSLDATLWGDGEWANETDWAGPGTVITGSMERNVWRDPDFVDPDGGDYHIGFDSAAIDRGVSAGVTSDLDGHPRPIPAGGSVDLGADESTGIDLSSSAKSACPSTAAPGDAVTYTIRLLNGGPLTAQDIRLLDPIPASTTYITGSARASQGLVLGDSTGVLWMGVLPPGQPVTITFGVTVTGEGIIENAAEVTDAYDVPTVLRAWVNGYRLFLPSVARSH